MTSGQMTRRDAIAASVGDLAAGEVRAQTAGPAASVAIPAGTSRPLLHLPNRDIPVPLSVSPKAQASLARAVRPQPDFPALDDHAAWRKMIAESDAAIRPMLEAAESPAPPAVEEIHVGQVPVYVVTPLAVAKENRRVCLEIHGGGLINAAGVLCRLMAVGVATRYGARVWSPDYRMPPDHPYPAGLDDCVAAYRELLRTHRPGEIIVTGSSAGGNLAAALILRARDEGLPLPAAAVLHTPEVDLTESGDTFETNLGLDSLLTRRLMPINILYAAGHDLGHPYLSPLFGDFSKGFPPTFLASGTRDLFLSNTVRMHRALRTAGVPADLHVFEAAPHGGFGGALEDEELAREIRCFIESHWQS